jgi:hypothetical protein
MCAAQHTRRALFLRLCARRRPPDAVCLSLPAGAPAAHPHAPARPPPEALARARPLCTPAARAPAARAHPLIARARAPTRLLLTRLSIGTHSPVRVRPPACPPACARVPATRASTTHALTLACAPTRIATARSPPTRSLATRPHPPVARATLAWARNGGARSSAVRLSGTGRAGGRPLSTPTLHTRVGVRLLAIRPSPAAIFAPARASRARSPAARPPTALRPPACARTPAAHSPHIRRAVRAPARPPSALCAPASTPTPAVLPRAPNLASSAYCLLAARALGSHSASTICCACCPPARYPARPPLWVAATRSRLQTQPLCDLQARHHTPVPAILWPVHMV